MKLYSSNKDYKLYEGNMLDMLDVIEPNSIDSIITDPPYELNFMNKGWDNSGIAFQKETWQKCYKVLKPGGYLLAFGGSRTFHRIACAIEDAGFEIRDTIMWLYGSGFPKSMDISKQIDKKKGVEREIVGIKNYSSPDFTKYDGSMMNLSNLKSEKARKHLYDTAPATELAKQWQGWGTALKPSYEPIIVARKPFKGSLVDNVIEYGVGGINIDECRVGNEEMKAQISGKTSRAFQSEATTTAGGMGVDHIGRFPANTILTYDDTDFDEVCGGFPNTKGGSPINFEKVRKQKIYGGNSLLESKTKGIGYYVGFNDSGSASRYFYCAKASKKDRDEGLDDFEATTDKAKGNGLDRVCEFCGVSQLTPELCHCEIKSWITKPKKNIHPTVKPTELMQYLVRLVSPEGATILDPFNGSGSTGKAVMYENKERQKNYKYIGIELTEEYLPISKARIDYVSSLKEDDSQTTIFDFIGGKNG